jgi:hypothetical protein
MSHIDTLTKLERDAIFSKTNFMAEPGPGFSEERVAGDWIAGESGIWTLELTVGAMGIDNGGRLLILKSMMTDWEDPDFFSSSSQGYTTVSTNGQAILKPSFGFKFFPRPLKWGICIDVTQESLAEGDTIVITSKGRAQTYIEHKHKWFLAVDPTSSVQPKLYGIVGSVNIVSGKAVKAVAVLPSQVLKGKKVLPKIRGEDRWGNSVEVTSWVINQVLVGNIPAAKPLNNSIIPIWDEPFRLELTAQFGTLFLKTHTNTARVLEAKQEKLNSYWGDLHGQAGSTIGTGSDDDYYKFARDTAFLDIVGHQGNDFQISDTLWNELQNVSGRYNQDHHFVTIPGYEWSGNTPAGGDRNVFYKKEYSPLIRSSNWLFKEKTTHDTATTALELYSKLKQQANPEDVIHCAHIGGRYADLSKGFDQELAGLIEVLSSWGIFEWHLKDALERGLIFGVVANSDGHLGRPGSEYPGRHFGVPGGLTCVLARELTRDAVFEALKNRHCYGTTGARIGLSLECGTAQMGDFVKISSDLEVTISVLGTAPIERIEMYVGSTPVQVATELLQNAVEESDCESLVKISWGGARSRGRNRQLEVSGTVSIDANGIDSNRLEIDKVVGFFDLATLPVVNAKGELPFKNSVSGNTASISLRQPKPDSCIRVKTNIGETHWTVGKNTKPQRINLSEGEGVFLQIERVVMPKIPALCWSGTFSVAAILKGRKKIGNFAAIWCKVEQIDGECAWSSPLYFF